MNKLVLVFGTLFVLCVFLSERAEGGKFLDNLCEKCSYCKIDPTCSGCADCSKCVNKKVRQTLLPLWPPPLSSLLSSQGNCRYCKIGESEDECKTRCTKGCGICGGKDGNGLSSCVKWAAKNKEEKPVKSVESVEERTESTVSAAWSGTSKSTRESCRTKDFDFFLVLLNIKYSIFHILFNIQNTCNFLHKINILL